MTLVGDDGELRGHPSTVPGNLRNDDDATKWVPTGVESFEQKSSRKLREINKTFNSNLK